MRSLRKVSCELSDHGQQTPANVQSRKWSIVFHMHFLHALNGVIYHLAVNQLPSDITWGRLIIPSHQGLVNNLAMQGSGIKWCCCQQQHNVYHGIWDADLLMSWEWICGDMVYKKINFEMGKMTDGVKFVPVLHPAYHCCDSIIISCICILKLIMHVNIWRQHLADQHLPLGQLLPWLLIQQNFSTSGTIWHLLT